MSSAKMDYVTTKDFKIPKVKKNKKSKISKTIQLISNSCENIIQDVENFETKWILLYSKICNKQ